MYSAMINSCFSVILIVCVVAVGYTNTAATEGKRCVQPPVAPLKIEKVIGQCQNEIKLALLQEALQILRENPGKSRSKREAFTDDEKRIAGCLLQCVYRKVKAVDAYGFPTVEGLARLYAEGVDEQGYVVATIQAVQGCLGQAQQKYSGGDFKEKGTTCDIAFDTFDCISDRIAEYCGVRIP